MMLFGLMKRLFGTFDASKLNPDRVRILHKKQKEFFEMAMEKVENKGLRRKSFFGKKISISDKSMSKKNYANPLLRELYVKMTFKTWFRYLKAKEKAKERPNRQSFNSQGYYLKGSIRPSEISKNSFSKSEVRLDRSLSWEKSPKSKNLGRSREREIKKVNLAYRANTQN